MPGPPDSPRAVPPQVSEVDWYLLEYEFKFYAKPYFLTLTFPGLVVEDGTERATFDPVEGVSR